MARGLGKGLDSLIPEYYDEDFDSNGAQSLEDMLNEDENAAEEIIDESNVEDIEESVEEDVDDEDSIVEDVDGDDRQEDQEELLQQETPDEEDSQEDNEDIISSEDVSDNQGSEDSISNPQEVKKQENVAEVLDIVDKNPRITLWSSRSAAVFRYLRKTEPEFSISREASILIDEAVSKKYPEIWDLFEDLK